MSASRPVLAVPSAVRWMECSGAAWRIVVSYIYMYIYICMCIHMYACMYVCMYIYETKTM